MDFTKRPGPQECFGYHRDYVANVPNGNIMETLTRQLSEIPRFIVSLPRSEMTVVHPPFSWRIHTVIEHCCDAERVMGYRALRFATGDQTELPGWDESHFARCGYGECTDPQALAEEFRALRQANLCLFHRLSENSFDQIGTANGMRASVRTLAWLSAGHWLHHQKILEKRLA